MMNKIDTVENMDTGRREFMERLIKTSVFVVPLTLGLSAISTHNAEANSSGGNSSSSRGSHSSSNSGPYYSSGGARTAYSYEHWDYPHHSHSSSVSVPEPGTLTLMGLGLAAVALAKRAKDSDNKRQYPITSNTERVSEVSKNINNTAPTETFSDFQEEELVAVLQSVKRLEQTFKQEFNLDIYLTWGTLLGAIREGDFIQFDTDIDIAYLTHQPTDYEIVEEHEPIVRVLRELGFPVQRHSKGQIHVEVKPEGKTYARSIFNLDLWTTWVRNDRFYHYPDIKGEITGTAVSPLRRHEFKGESFWIPTDHNQVLTQFYGENWLKPDPGYAWHPRYDSNDAFEFLRSSPSKINIPKFPGRANDLQSKEKGDLYFYQRIELKRGATIKPNSNVNS